MDSSLMLGPPETPATPSQRWLARLSFALAALAVVIVAVFAGLKSFAMLAVALAGAVVAIAAAYFFLSRRGMWRWLSLAVFRLAPIAALIAYAFARLPVLLTVAA